MSDLPNKVVITDPPNATEMYGMQLHEVLHFPNNHIFRAVMRVPGGWTYIVRGGSDFYVPYHNEFQEK